VVVIAHAVALVWLALQQGLRPEQIALEVEVIGIDGDLAVLVDVKEAEAIDLRIRPEAPLELGEVLQVHLAVPVVVAGGTARVSEALIDAGRRGAVTAGHKRRQRESRAL